MLTASEPAAPIKWRVKHQPAKTVYMVKCHNNLTLTVGYGEPVPPEYDSYADGERTDFPECWALWGRWVGCKALTIPRRPQGQHFAQTD